MNGFCAVAMGALGAHAAATPELGLLLARGSEYQLIHAAVLLWLSRRAGRLWLAARCALLAGVCLFSFSLYARGLGLAEHAPLAPAGGTLLMLSWLLIAAAAKTAE